MSYSNSLHLFESFGVEVEYMIVDAQTLQVRPITDLLIREQAGTIVSEVEVGELAWSNELVLHVLELKTREPASSLARLPALFQQQVILINQLLAPFKAMLLPGGMHPLMNPATDTLLWPHDFNTVYQAYDRIFNCQGHGWANLQSTHLNLPFSDDEEFGRLHAATRLVLPILPALCASSPLVEGRYSGLADTRLEMYRQNQARIPAIAGSIIPEAVFNRQDYETQILQRIYRDIAPYDTAGVLQEEFLNSRGAIARFSRGSLEIRLADTQECPQADLAILQVLVTLIRKLAAGKWVSFKQQQSWHQEELAEILLEVIARGLDAEISNAAFLHLFGFSGRTCTTRELWQHLWQQVQAEEEPGPEVRSVMEVLLSQGNLSDRIRAALGPKPDTQSIIAVYQQLAECLATGVLFKPKAAAL